MVPGGTTFRTKVPGAGVAEDVQHIWHGAARPVCATEPATNPLITCTTAPLIAPATGSDPAYTRPDKGNVGSGDDSTARHGDDAAGRGQLREGAIVDRPRRACRDVRRRCR